VAGRAWHLNTPTPASQPVVPITKGVTCAEDMHRPVDPMHDSDPAAEAAGVLDLDGEIVEAVTIEVADSKVRVQSGRERELLIETSPAQRAVRPDWDAPEGARRDLRTSD